MGNSDRETRILKATMNFENDLENNNVEKIPFYFSDDCVIELLGITYKGKEGLRKWLELLFSNVAKLRYIVMTVVVKDDMLFEEYVLNVETNKGIKFQSRQIKVTVYDPCGKIKNLRFYYDRHDLAHQMYTSI